MRRAIFIPINSRPSPFSFQSHIHTFFVLLAKLNYLYIYRPFAAAASAVMNTNSFTAASGVKQNRGGGGRREEETAKKYHQFQALLCGFILVFFSFMGFSVGVTGRDMVLTQKHYTQLGFDVLVNVGILLFVSMVGVLISAWFLVQHILVLTRFRTTIHLLDQYQEYYSIYSDCFYNSNNHSSPSRSLGKLCDAV